MRNGRVGELVGADVPGNENAFLLKVGVAGSICRVINAARPLIEVSVAHDAQVGIAVDRPAVQGFTLIFAVRVLRQGQHGVAKDHWKEMPDCGNAQKVFAAPVVFVGHEAQVVGDADALVGDQFAAQAGRGLVLHEHGGVARIEFAGAPDALDFDGLPDRIGRIGIIGHAHKGAAPLRLRRVKPFSSQK